MQANDPIVVLNMEPLNGTFVSKQLILHANDTPLKIGRKVSQKQSSDISNAIFDSKVLSRNHAEIWAERDSSNAELKVFIKDVKSSNGTFVNGRRLSEEGLASDPVQLKDKDFIDFGIDILNEDNLTIMYQKVSLQIFITYTTPSALSSLPSPPISASPSSTHSTLSHTSAITSFSPSTQATLSRDQTFTNPGATVTTKPAVKLNEVFVFLEEEIKKSVDTKKELELVRVELDEMLNNNHVPVVAVPSIVNESVVVGRGVDDRAASKAGDRDLKEITELEVQRDRLEKEVSELKQRAEMERVEKERIAKELTVLAEKEKIEMGKIQRERAEWEAKEKREKERVEKERVEMERVEEERKKKAQLEKEKFEQVQMEKQLAESKRLEEERVKREKLEAERLELQKHEDEKKKVILNKLESELKEKEELIERLIQSQTIEGSEIVKLKEENKRVRDLVEEYTGLNEVLKSEVVEKKVEVESIKSELAKLEAEKTQILKQVEQLTTEIRQIKSDKESTHARSLDLEKGKISAEKKIEEFHTVRIELDSKISGLESELRIVKKREEDGMVFCGELTCSLEENKERVKELETEKAELDKLIFALNTKIAQFEVKEREWAQKEKEWKAKEKIWSEKEKEAELKLEKEREAEIKKEEEQTLRRRTNAVPVSAAASPTSPASSTTVTEENSTDLRAVTDTSVLVRFVSVAAFSAFVASLVTFWTVVGVGKGWINGGV